MGLRLSFAGFVVATLVVVAVVAPVGGASAAVDPVRADNAGLGGLVAQTDIETDNVRLVVVLSENGSARWQVQYWTRLDDDNTTAAFESLRRDIEANPANYSRQFAARMRSTVAAAENATGREMAASNFSVHAETRGPPQYGVVVYSFQWAGFAAVDGDAMRVGDAIEGMFLDSSTRLIVEWPTGFRATTVAPEATERRDDAVVWRGADTNFVSGEPTLVLTRGSGTADSPDGGDGGTAAPDGSSNGWLSAILGVVALVGVAAVAWGVWSGRRDDTADARPPDDGGPPPDDSLADAGTESEPRPELLSNEERVLHFVRQQGGRVKQQEIVQEFDWTEARTSQIVRDLRDDGQLEGFRLGRENVLKLPDDAPDGDGSGETDRGGNP